MKSTLILLLVVVAFPLAGQQLREFIISDLPRPEVAVVQANTQFPDDALVLVYCAIEGLDFRSSLGAIDKQTYNASASRYELLVKPVKQLLFATKAGFIEAKITTLNPNPKDVYYFKVEEKKNASPEKSEPGLLQINTTPPGADIFLNDIQIIDKTPFKGAATAGNMRIKIRKKKYAEFDTTVTIESLKTTAVSVEFKSTYLYLAISSNPSGASVKLDGIELGKTPFNKEIDLSDFSKQGLKTLRLQLDGYEEIENPINYSPSNKPLELNYELKKIKGNFQITSVPEGASVYIDGAFKGLTPYSGTREFGTFDIKVELDGFRSSENRKMELNDFTIKKLNFTLIPLPKPGEETEAIVNEIKIGKRVWMAENLNADHFQNGDLIPEAKSADEWIRAGDKKQPAWCYYDNELKNGEKYGKLYNWYAVSDPRNVCPTGWHVPSDAEWSRLTDYLGGESVAGGKMKALKYWNPPNSAAAKQSKFGGLPGGYRFSVFYNVGDSGHWWSDTENGTDTAWTRDLGYKGGDASRYSANKHNGLSVRCLRD
jgi:uncharacterized protein (TIGR02145 family)